MATIGEFVGNVPEPGLPVQSPWAQQVTNRVIHHFTNVADRDAKWPANAGNRGGLCVTLDTVRVWYSTGAAWQAVGEPAGTVRATVAVVADPGWFMLDGTVIANANTSYPDLWAVAPAAWKSGSSLVLPNMSDRVLRGAGSTGAGVLAGTNSRALAAGHMAPHAHGVEFVHNHSSAPAAGGIGINKILGASSGWTVNAAAANRVQEWETTDRIGTTETTPDSSSVTDNGPGGSAAFDITPAHMGIVWQVRT